MADKRELQDKFWKALKSDMTMMLGLVGVEESHLLPMTAQMEDEGRGPIWFFTSRDNSLVQNLKRNGRAVGTFVSKGHDLFATVHGQLIADNDQDTIDRLWNPFIAAWFEGGRDDPNLVLLRFDAEKAEIWLNENNFLAGIKMLFGSDPKKDYKDKVAEVKLR
jgi:general stress protein 26